MEQIIVYVDDAAFARENIARLLPAEATAASARHWVLVACPPRMTHRISKWVSHSARENWRAKWLRKTLDEITPTLCRPGDRLTSLLAKGPLAELTQQLQRAHGPVTKVIDARRPRIGVDMEPVAPGVLPPTGRRGPALPGAAMGLGALLVMANELAD